MKYFISLFAFLSFQVNGVAQTNIRIILKTDLKIDSINVFDVSSKEYYIAKFKDTIDIKFKKEHIDLYNIRYFDGSKMYGKQIWLDAGDITIKAHTDNSNLIIDTVANSAVYYDVINYYKTVSSLKKSRDTIGRNNFLLSEIQKNIENPRSIFIAFEYINFNQSSNPKLQKLKILLKEQKTDLSWFMIYPAVMERLDKLLEVKTIHLSDFKVTDRQNKITTMDLDKCDYFVLDFWFVGCTSCVQQHRVIKGDYLKLKNKKIAVLGISTDANFKLWDDYLSQHGYNWDNYLQSGKNRLSDYLGIYIFPAYVLVNKKGEVIANYDSWAAVMTNLDKNNN